MLDNAALTFYTALPSVGSLGSGICFSSFRLVRPRTRRKEAFPPFTLIAFPPPCPRLKGKLRLFFNANIPRFP